MQTVRPLQKELLLLPQALIKEERDLVFPTCAMPHTFQANLDQGRGAPSKCINDKQGRFARSTIKRITEYRSLKITALRVIILE